MCSKCVCVLDHGRMLAAVKAGGRRRRAGLAVSGSVAHRWLAITHLFWKQPLVLIQPREEREGGEDEKNKMEMTTQYNTGRPW